MKLTGRSIVIFALLVFSSIANSQTSKTQHVDSLLNELSLAQEDSNKVMILNELSWDYLINNLPEEAEIHLNEALALAQKINYLKGEAVANNYRGIKYQIASDYAEAYNYYMLSLEQNEKAGYQKGIAFSNQSVGVIYFIQGSYLDAIKYYTTAINIYEAIGDKKGIAYIYSNNAGCYTEVGLYEEAIDNFTKSLNIFTELGDKGGISVQINLIGENYALLKDYEQALECFKESLEFAEQEGRARLLSSALIGLGQTYTQLKDYKKARESYNRALVESKNFKNKGSYRDIYEGISILDSIAGNWSGAFHNHLLYVSYRDSVKNEEGSKETIKAQMNFAFAKKAAIAKVEQEKKDIRNRNFRNAIAGTLVGSLIFLIIVYRQRNKTAKEKRRSEELLLNILPAEIAEELKEHGKAEARNFQNVSIVFTDFVAFTQTSEKLSAQELVAEINSCFEAFDLICDKYDIEKIKTIGDAYMAAGGIPIPTDDSAKNATLAALEMQSFIIKRKLVMDEQGKPAFKMRVGIHTGSVVAGIVGIKKFQYDIWGDAVNTAARMESSGEADKVNISHSTFELIKEDASLVFESRGKISAKGKGEMEMYFVKVASA